MGNSWPCLSPAIKVKRGEQSAHLVLAVRANCSLCQTNIPRVLGTDVEGWESQGNLQHLANGIFCRHFPYFFWLDFHLMQIKIDSYFHTSNRPADNTLHTVGHTFLYIALRINHTKSRETRFSQWCCRRLNSSGVCCVERTIQNKPKATVSLHYFYQEHPSDWLQKRVYKQVGGHFQREL